MDDLIKALEEKAGLSRDQAKAAARVVVEYMKQGDNGKKIAALAATTAAINVVVLPHAR